VTEAVAFSCFGGHLGQECIQRLSGAASRGF
jgi:hypothetical protein